MLLPSNEQIHKIKSKERKLEIDEGIKIAKKVDALRNTILKEEEKLATFKEQTVSQVTEEIAVLLEQKEKVARQVLELEEKKRVALLPITKELKNLQEAREEHKDSLSLIETHKLHIAREKATILTEQSKLERENKKLEKKKETIHLLERDVTEKQKQIQQELFTIQQQRKDFEKEYSEKLNVVNEKIKVLDYDIKHYKDFTENLKKKEKQVDTLLLRYGNRSK